MKPEDVILPEEALSEKFLAATGPGGQNVNKVATACQLRADVFKLGLAPDVLSAAEGHRRQQDDQRRRARDHRAALPHARRPTARMRAPGWRK